VGVRVVFLLFAPKGRAEGRKAWLPSSSGHTPETSAGPRSAPAVDGMLVRPFVGWIVAASVATVDLTFGANELRLRSCPAGGAETVSKRVRPILENSTACTCHMPNYPRPVVFRLVENSFGSIIGCQQ